MNETDIVLHQVNVKLYKNHFRNVPGRNIARTSNEKTLNTTDIVTALRTEAIPAVRRCPDDYNESI